MYKDKKYILMDLDGTLTDSFFGITRSVQYALKHFGIKEYDLDKLSPFIGPPLMNSFQDFYGFSVEQATEAVEKYREYYSEFGWSDNQVYGGIKDFLKEQIENGRKLYVTTSKPEIFAKKILHHFDLAKYFELIGGATLDQSRSHKVDVIRYVIEIAGIENLNEAVMIGDRKFDVEGAHLNGIECIGVLYGYGSREEMEASGSDCIVTSVTELSSVLPGKK